MTIPAPLPQRRKHTATPGVTTVLRKAEFKVCYLAKGLKLYVACAAMVPPISPRLVNAWRTNDREFAEWYDRQHRLWTETAEAEAEKRAMEGTDKQSTYALLRLIESRPDSLYYRKRTPDDEYTFSVKRIEKPLPKELPEGAIEGEFTEEPT